MIFFQEGTLKPSKMNSSGCVDTPTYPVFRLTPSECREIEETKTGVILDPNVKDTPPQLLRRTL